MGNLNCPNARNFLVFLSSVIFLFICILIVSNSLEQTSTKIVKISSNDLINEFREFPKLLKEIENRKKANQMIELEIPSMHMKYFKSNMSFFDFLNGLFESKSQSTNHFEEGICWAYAIASMINGILIEKGFRNRGYELYVAVLVLIYGKNEKSNEEMIDMCPLFNVTCSKIKKDWGWIFWGQKTIEEQVYKILNKGNGLIGFIEFTDDKFKKFVECQKIENLSYAWLTKKKEYAVYIEKISKFNKDFFIIKNFWGINCKGIEIYVHFEAFETFIEGHYN